MSTHTSIWENTQTCFSDKLCILREIAIAEQRDNSWNNETIFKVNFKKWIYKRKYLRPDENITIDELKSIYITEIENYEDDNNKQLLISALNKIFLKLNLDRDTKTIHSKFEKIWNESIYTDKDRIAVLQNEIMIYYLIQLGCTKCLRLSSYQYPKCHKLYTITKCTCPILHTCCGCRCINKTLEEIKEYIESEKQYINQLGDE